MLLPRFVNAATVERCLDHCLAHRLVSVDAVRDLVEGLPARAVPGRRMLLDLLTQRSEGIGHRSRLEQTVRGWLDGAGLHGWKRNYRAPVGSGRRVEVDFGWPAAKVALEISPFFTHGSRAAQERDAQRRRLLVLAGWRVVEATDPDVESQRGFAGVVASLSSLLLDTSRALTVAGRHGAHATERAAGERRLGLINPVVGSPESLRVR